MSAHFDKKKHSLRDFYRGYINFLFKQLRHLVAEFACFFAGAFGEVCAVGGIDYAAGGVYEKPAVVSQTAFRYFLEAAALCSDAGHEEEAVRSDTAYFVEHLGLCRTTYEHQFVGRSPGLSLLHHGFKQRGTFLIFNMLEVETSPPVIMW